MTLCISPIADLSASDNVLISWECTATGRLSLALSDDPPRSAVMFIQGNPRGDIGAADRARWNAATGLTFPAAVSTHTEAALWLLTGLADPAGIDAPLPLGPTSEGRYELWMGGEAAFVLDSNSTRYEQAITAAKARQKAMQLRKIKAMVRAKDIPAIRDHVGKFGMAKLRNYLGKPLGRDWQNKAQNLLDDWFSGDADLRSAIKAKFPSTEVTETGSSGSGVWTQYAAGGSLNAATWSFSSGEIRVTSSVVDYTTAQRYSTPLSSDDMYCAVTTGTTTMDSFIEPVVRLDSASSMNGYSTFRAAAGSFGIHEWNSSSLSTTLTVNPGAPSPTDIVFIFTNGTTHSIGTSGAVTAGHSFTDTTHQGVDHVYFGVGPAKAGAGSQIARISQAYAADLFAAGGGGGRRPRAFRVGA